MGTQDFVRPSQIDIPRHEQNMPEDVETPVPQGWYADRPGDNLENSNGTSPLNGNIGPGGGFALTLVSKMRNDIHLLDHEHFHDVKPLVAEIAMRRASHLTRSPVKADVETALELLGFNNEATEDEKSWRIALVHDCGHNEHRRRKIVNSIPIDLLIAGVKSSSNEYEAWKQDLQQFL